MFDDTLALTDLARGLGSEALTTCGVAGALLLWTTAGLWGFGRHLWVPRLRSSWPPELFLALHLIFAAALAVGFAGLFAALAGGIAPDGRLSALDNAFLQALRPQVTPELARLATAITRLGDTATWLTLGLGVSVAVTLLARPWLALSWWVALLGNAAINHGLKAWFERPRPLLADGSAAGLVAAQGASFPSGHASAAVVAYGLLAWLLLTLLPPRWVNRLGLLLVLAAVAAAFAVACSRVFLGVHHPSDVLAGAASGTAWLLLCLGGFALLGHRRRPRA